MRDLAEIYARLSRWWWFRLLVSFERFEARVRKPVETSASLADMTNQLEVDKQRSMLSALTPPADPDQSYHRDLVMRGN